MLQALVIEKQLVESISRNEDDAYEHGLLPTNRLGIVVCIIVGLRQRHIEGYYVLDVAADLTINVQIEAWRLTLAY